MVVESQIGKILSKLRELEKIYAHNIFEKIEEVPAQFFETKEHFRNVPTDAPWEQAAKGQSWGGPWMNAWFKGTVTIPDGYQGKELYITVNSTAVESFCFINGRPRGLVTKPNSVLDGWAHTAVFLASGDDVGKTFDVAFECYAGHPCIGTQPYENYGKTMEDLGSFRQTFDGIWLYAMREDVKDFVFDLRTLNQMVAKLPRDSFRRAAIVNGLIDVYQVLIQYPVEHPVEEWRQGLRKAREIMRPLLEKKNSDSAPIAGIVGHSHMDTAWLWTVDETIRKCARTYSNALALMEQYPEYTFIQSSALHLDWMRRYYPDIFEGIKQRVAEGRYEPNGGVWVECDCNITSGESMIRQFLWGQRFTQKYLGYTSDTFWLPDTFGYNAAIPQIMKGCRIDNFLTTKLAWNDTNRFPFESFIWRGIDGSEVLTHLNCIHTWPDPENLFNNVNGFIQNKHVSNMRLVAYGYGDGGGGPIYEMLEAARRVEDLEGCPRAEHTSVSGFMKKLKETSRNLPVYAGELYVEVHRGTLTQMHQIKRNNRLAEFALRDLEILNVFSMLLAGADKNPKLERLYGVLLMNQFHDILPGTSLPEVHDRAIRELDEVITEATAEQKKTMETLCADDSALTIFNTLSWPRENQVMVDAIPGDLVPADYPYQRFENVFGEQKLAIGNMNIPPLAAMTIDLKGNVEPVADESPFRVEGDVLTTPYYQVTFDENGFITSLVDLRCDREIRGNGYPLNTFLMGEDVPAAWDNWDIDADIKLKLTPQNQLKGRKVVANGPLQLRIRSIYAIGRFSELRQDMIFYVDDPRIDFETEVDWQDPHSLLKVDFDVNVLANTMRNEIQFGHVERPTHSNTPYDAAKFEVSNHKWTDISENRYGVAILNDCKYGISAEGSDLRLTLHKGGCRPDHRGDVGVHRMTYSFLPHVGAFNAENVIRPSYELNVPVKAIQARLTQPVPSLVTVDQTNVIVEAIKPAEDERAYVIRLYEAERASVKATLQFGFEPKKVVVTNMLEEPEKELVLDGNNSVSVDFRAFEIKTIMVYI